MRLLTCLYDLLHQARSISLTYTRIMHNLTLVHLTSEIHLELLQKMLFLPCEFGDALP